MAEIEAPEHSPGERLVVCRNPDLADERARKREHLLAASERALAQIQRAVRRTRAPLRGAAGIDQAVGAYKTLGRVERAVRSLKTLDLEIRPVFHGAAPRVRAHVFLCMLAYYVEARMRQRLAPILFDDHDPEGAAAERGSIVAPAERSAAATRKAAARRTDDDVPVHSFRGLLDDLGTLCLNTISLPSNPDYSFDQPTKPTPLQARAFELLGVSP